MKFLSLILVTIAMFFEVQVVHAMTSCNYATQSKLETNSGGNPSETMTFSWEEPIGKCRMTDWDSSTDHCHWKAKEKRAKCFQLSSGKMTYRKGSPNNSIGLDVKPCFVCS